MANPVASFYRLIPRRVKSDRLLAVHDSVGTLNSKRKYIPWIAQRISAQVRRPVDQPIAY